MKKITKTITSPIIFILLIILITFIFPTTTFAVVQSLNGQTGKTQSFASDTNVTMTSVNNNHSLGWNGVLPVSRGGTGSGSFTVGSVLFSNGTSISQDNSNLFWDDINDRLTIKNLSSTNDITINTLTAGMGGGSNSSNTAFGINALLNNAAGYYNTAVGYGTLAANTGNIKNTAVGSYALNNSYGEANTAVGSQALRYNTSGSYNTALGDEALSENTTGIRNTALGLIALVNNISGNNNVAAGFASLSGNTTGGDNIAIGYNSMPYNETGGGNVVLGSNAAMVQADGATHLTTANNSIYIGSEARGYNNSDSNSLVIGTQAIGAGSNKAVIGNSSITDVYFGSSAGNANIHAANICAVSSGTSAPSSTPVALGQIYVDTTNAKVYISTGTSSSSDWVIIN